MSVLMEHGLREHHKHTHHEYHWCPDVSSGVSVITATTLRFVTTLETAQTPNWSYRWHVKKLFLTAS